jgi:4-amino-4-deoxy-L-arabinose transferase-like glycosyltransferase
MAAILLIYALHFVHLSADFPNGARWIDPVKYTDEGWYLNAATRHFLGGNWYVAGDFNPAIAAPLWQLLAWTLFHFTGVSVVASRALVVVAFGITLAASYLFVRRHNSRALALTVVTFAVIDPFLFAFERLAILEPVILCLFSLAVLCADVGAASKANWRLIWLGGTALLLALMLFTKPTALVFFPVVAYVFWRSYRGAQSAFWIYATAIVSLVAAAYAAYYAAVVHFGYAADYHYLFSANNFLRPTGFKMWIVDAKFCVQGLLTVEPFLAIPAILIGLLSLQRPMRSLWRNPAYGAALLTLFLNVFYVFWRSYQPPHYYLFAAIPLSIVVVSGCNQLVRSNSLGQRRQRLVSVVIVLMVGLQLSALIHFYRKQTYTFVSAAKALTLEVRRHRDASDLLLGESADQISLLAGLPAISDDFGTDSLQDEIARLHPGWFVSWNSVEPTVLAAIHQQYHLQKVCSYPVMDDRRHSPLILYKLVPLTDPETGVVLRPPGIDMLDRAKR